MNSPLQYLAECWAHWLCNVWENVMVWGLMSSKYTEKSCCHSTFKKTKLMQTHLAGGVWCNIILFGYFNIKCLKLYEIIRHNYQNFIYSPTDAPVSCHKKTILQFTLKFTSEQLRNVSVLQLHHHRGAH